jgi:hypothetical protein
VHVDVAQNLDSAGVFQADALQSDHALPTLCRTGPLEPSR